MPPFSFIATEQISAQLASQIDRNARYLTGLQSGGARKRRLISCNLPVFGYDEGMIRLKRAYERAAPSDGKRFLVERLWPRGVKKDSLPLEAWVKEVAPTTALRRWFGHDERKWAEFRRRYFAELDASRDTWRPILEAAQCGEVTLVYSSHDTEHNNAAALRDYLEARMTRRRRAEPAPLRRSAA